MDTTPRCPRDPDVETRLRCWSCEELICPRCSVEAASGYLCPNCAGGAATSAPARSRVDLGPATKGTAVAAAAALVGGLVLAPIFQGGMLALISSGIIGWAIAKAVDRVAGGLGTPYLRAVALAAAGFSVAVGLVVAGASAAPAGILFLAYPAAVYGAWIDVRHHQ